EQTPDVIDVRVTAGMAAAVRFAMTRDEVRARRALQTSIELASANGCRLYGADARVLAWELFAFWGDAAALRTELPALATLAAESPPDRFATEHRFWRTITAAADPTELEAIGRLDDVAPTPARLARVVLRRQEVVGFEKVLLESVLRRAGWELRVLNSQS